MATDTTNSKAPEDSLLSSSSTMTSAPIPLPSNNPSVQAYSGALSKTLTDMIGSITPITPYLSVSGCLPVSTQSLLQDEYTAVVCCMDGFEYDFPPDRLDFVHIRIQDARDTDLRPHFDSVCRLIDTHRQRRQATGSGRTLVFCAQGISRSVSFILAYLMKYERMSLLESFDLVRQRRRLACPNVGFFKQLIELEGQLRDGQQSVAMIEPYKGFEVADIVWKYSGDMLKEFRQGHST